MSDYFDSGERKDCPDESTSRGDAPQPPVAAETPEQIALRCFPIPITSSNPYDYERIEQYRTACYLALRDQARQYEAKFERIHNDHLGRDAGECLADEVAAKVVTDIRAERATAVGQVAKFVVAIPQWKISVESAVAKLDPQKCSLERNRLIRLIDYMEEAIASSAPLVAAYKAEIEAGALEEAIKSAPSKEHTMHLGDDYIRVGWLRASAQEKRKAGTQAGKE